MTNITLNAKKGASANGELEICVTMWWDENHVSEMTTWQSYGRLSAKVTQ